jgi:hypothetical protein
MSDRDGRELFDLPAGIERRDFLKTSALAGAGAMLGFLGVPPANANPPENAVWAYPDTFSILPTQPLRLHLAADQVPTTAAISIYKLTQWSKTGWVGAAQLPVTTTVVTHLNNGPSNATSSGIEDWSWNQTVDIDVQSLPPGLYIADVRPYGSAAVPADTCWVEFVVRNPALAPVPSILFKVSLNTFQAYNGGPLTTPVAQQNSFYGGPVQVGGKIKITFRRPFSTAALAIQSLTYDYALVWWLERQGYAVDFCTDVDVHLDTNLSLLSKYALLISSGHDEYWSEGMYGNVTSYRNRGGNVMFLSGNTCCWKVEYGNPDTLLNIPTSLSCGKTPFTRDISGPAAWWEQAEGPRDNALVGAGTRNCAVRQNDWSPPFANSAYFPALIPRTDGYRVQNADHWVFAGTGLQNGQVIGYHDSIGRANVQLIENIIGPEGGGARIDAFEPDGSGHLALNDGTPANLALLGVSRTGSSPSDLVYAADCGDPCTVWKAFSREDSPGVVNYASIYAATMGHYGSYGSVFTASTMNWGNVLNEWDVDAGEWRPEPQQWQTANGPAYLTDSDGKPILGNRFLHRITRNLIDAMTDRTREVRAVTGNLLVMQTKTTGEPSFWRVNGTARTASGSILYNGTSSPGKRMRLATAASLTAAGSMELIFQDTDDGYVAYWTIIQAADGTISRQQGQQGQQVTLLRPEWADPSWKLRVAIDQHAASGSRNLLVFQDTGTGMLYYWQLDGTTLSAGWWLNPSWGGDPLWRPVAALDLNGDGKDDLLFQHENTRELYYWLLDGVNVIGSGPLGSPPAPNWYVVGSCDVNGSGQKDVVFQKRDTGELYYWAVTANPINAVATGPLNPGGSTTTWFL